MIRADMIPDEVVEAYVDAFYAKDMTRKAAIAAALNAWPGAWHVDAVDFEPKLILPLPAEQQ